MISYFNYEIKHNLEKLQKLKLVNNKKLDKKFIEKEINQINQINVVNSLPKNTIPIAFHLDNIVETLDNTDYYIKYDANSNTDNETKINYEKLDLTDSHNDFLSKFNIKTLNAPTSYLGINIVDNDTNNQFNKSVISKKMQTKIIHIVYQYKYKNKSVTGFGDLLRSIYFMLQFSEKYGLKFEININKHIVKKYLEYFCSKNDLDSVVENNIYFYDKGNFKYTYINNVIEYEYIDIDEEILHHLNNLESYNNHLYLYLINHPNQSIITEKHKDIVKNIIKPTEELQSHIDKFMFNLNLQKNNYIAIHIRYYDEQLMEINNQFLQRINFIIKMIIHIKNKYKIDILLFTSQNIIKNYIIKQLPYIKTHFNPICHTCDNNSKDETIINTLKDFYVMSYSKAIYSFSVYEHGSGFSKWCATTYNIPYICYSIQ